MNEVICFVANHFLSIPVESIVTVTSVLYEENELVKAKVLLHYICVNTLQNVDTPRIITHRKGNFKRKLNSEDIITFFYTAG